MNQIPENLILKNAAHAAAADAAHAATTEKPIMQQIVEAAKSGGYSAARKVADELIGVPMRVKWAPIIAETNKQAQDLVIRLCAMGRE